MSEEFPLPTGPTVPRVPVGDKDRAAPTSNTATARQGYASDGLDSEEIHLSDYVRVLHKRRWVALAAFLIVFLTTAVYTITSTPIYQARVQILIEKENANVVTFKEAFEQNQITDDYYQTQYRILQSRALARRTIDALELWSHPYFNPAPDNGLSLRQIARMPASWIVANFRVAPPEPPAPDETAVQSRTIDRFLGCLTVSPIRNSRLVDVKIDLEDAALSARIANALATQYIEQNLEFKYTSSKEASDWLGERLAEQRKQVDVTEQALQRYREQTDSVSLEDRQNIVVQKLADLNAAVTRAKTERIQKESAYNQIRNLQNDRSALDTIPAILSNSFVQQQKSELAELQRLQAQLSEKLGPRHPEMVKTGLAIRNAEAKIQGEIAKVVQAMRNDYQQAQAQEKSLTDALEQQKRDALELNRKEIAYGALARDAASNRQIFDSLMQRTKETGIAGELRSSNIRVVDAAELPRRPVTPNVRNNLLVALFGGLTLGIGLAFFFEYLDSNLKTPDDVKRHLGLPFFGMIPALFDKSIVNPLMNNGVPPNFSESFRAVRTNLLFSTTLDQGRSVVVTSTGPGEGKTLTACNLAVGLAQTGQRVLIMDADLRKPRVHAVFEKRQDPGLSNVIVGTSKSSESIHRTTVPTLWVMPAGKMPPNPAELLGSKRFHDLMASVTQHFDWVVVDTPPVMAVTDSAVVAHLATGVLFVVGAEMTSRHAARRALEQLERGRAKFLGAVLNRVDLQHNSYYYSQYYRRDYADYYKRGTGARS